MYIRMCASVFLRKTMRMCPINTLKQPASMANALLRDRMRHLRITVRQSSKLVIGWCLRGKMRWEKFNINYIKLNKKKKKNLQVASFNILAQCVNALREFTSHSFLMLIFYRTSKVVSEWVSEWHLRQRPFMEKENKNQTNKRLSEWTNERTTSQQRPVIIVLFTVLSLK